MANEFEPGSPIPASEEVLHHALEEIILAEDWRRRFSVNFAVLGAVNHMLTDEQAPEAVMDLAVAKRVRLEKTLGAGVLSLWQQDILASRRQFEEQFGW